MSLTRRASIWEWRKCWKPYEVRRCYEEPVVMENANTRHWTYDKAMKAAQDWVYPDEPTILKTL